MNRYAATGSMLMIAFMAVPFAHAEPPVNVQLEVAFLLSFVEGSRCAFYRNGTGYDSKMAEAHLRGKYRYLVARDQIKTTEDFIEKAASTSVFTGQPYEVRCVGTAAETSNQWLRDELERFRILRGCSQSTACRYPGHEKEIPR